MSLVDIEKIINGTPEKVLRNSYKAMKENYNETTAQEYYNVYSNQPLSFLYENSRMIFSEPYFGYDYYKEAIENISLCNFTVLESEKEKVLSYIEENKDEMSEKQLKMYERLESCIDSILEHTKNTRISAEYVKEYISPDFEEGLSNALFAYEKQEEKDSSEIIGIMESVNSPIVSMVYAPYINGVISDSVEMKKMCKPLVERCVDEVFTDRNVIYQNIEDWRSYIEKVVIANKLSSDTVYNESVQNIQNRNTRIVFNIYTEASLSDIMYDIMYEKHSDTIVPSSSPERMVNSIFDDMYESVVYRDMYEAEKEKNHKIFCTVLETVMDMMLLEYQNTDDTTSFIEGYSFFKTSQTFESAWGELQSLLNEYSSDVVQESDEDTSDDAISDLDKEVNDDGHYGSNETGKKPQAPKPKNLANKVQFKAMNAEANQRRRMSDHEQKGQEIKNAVNAVAQLPKNVINSIKDQVHKLDEKDDDRRKNYMTEPGFRKKAFRNLKLAIMYGTAANIKLSLIPVVALSRHYSKKKDIRMRNELVREINTEIKVCEEKIADANANNDNKEKYRLIRIKDQLNAEMVRVKTNSKFV